MSGEVTRMSFIERMSRRRGVRQLMKFGIVGTSGFVVNLVIFTILQKQTSLPYWADFSIGFMLGGVSNWFLNRIWTFRSDAHPGREGAQFLTVSFLALLVGNVTGSLLENGAHFHYHHRVWFLSTLSGMVVNFFVNKYWTFRDAR